MGRCWFITPLLHYSCGLICTTSSVPQMYYATDADIDARTTSNWGRMMLHQHCGQLHQLLTAQSVSQDEHVNLQTRVIVCKRCLLCQLGGQGATQNPNYPSKWSRAAPGSTHLLYTCSTLLCMLGVDTCNLVTTQRVTQNRILSFTTLGSEHLFCRHSL